ncbi:response regulator transcription factor [Sphingosinicella sp. GR2756]|uniref:Response regulator transcription factor n=2 Tax=Sphingosinicella rhizophila TaxID=3050082 RepID=A0ABU3Q6G6_9SPHN|nr:response regulator transcription factor [Sphingosinicella sp. GR2756]MDT9599000.1 response regulator transcription factor [Sphingosinicella sp. GR2756]
MDGQRVHLVDDDEGIRRSASFLLRTSGFIVVTYASGVDLLKDPKAIEPGCILLDVRMPEMDGLEVQQALAEKGVLLPVIIMTGHGDIDLAVRAMKAGAVDFIEKPFDKATLVGALTEGFARLADAGRREANAAEALAKLQPLTARERDVLEGLVRGHPNKTIAYDLGISPRTVEIHRANLMNKLGVPSLSEALRIAFAAGLDGDAALQQEDLGKNT